MKQRCQLRQPCVKLVDLSVLGTNLFKEGFLITPQLLDLGLKELDEGDIGRGSCRGSRMLGMAVGTVFFGRNLRGAPQLGLKLGNRFMESFPQFFPLVKLFEDAQATAV